MSDAQIRSYYACFNERRIQDAAALFTSDAIVLHVPWNHNERGARAYQRFAETWIRAFPDAVLTAERIASRGDTLWEVDLCATGTHLGVLELGSLGTLKPTGTQTTVRLRELLDVRNSHVVFSSLSLDVQALIQQLTIIDYAALMHHLDRIGQLRTELARSTTDHDRQREVTQRLGRELDATRHVIRPHFKV
jgi:predicted ester cyclase